MPHPEELDFGLDWRGRWALRTAGKDAGDRRGILHWKPEMEHLSLLSVGSRKGLLEVLWLPTLLPLATFALSSRLLLFLGFSPSTHLPPASEPLHL